MRLDFVVPGFAKCGTTTLWSMLREHPEVFMPETKDFRLFDLATCERRWTLFEDRFRDADGFPVVGDSSIWYTDNRTEQRARVQMLERFPELKLIFIVRDPLDRIESAFRELHHSQSRHGVDCPLELTQALLRFPDLIEDSRYARRLDNFAGCVDEERILVLFLEEFVRAPGAELARCFRFLGVDPGAPLEDAALRLNRGTTKYRDSERLRELRDDPAADATLRAIPHSVQDRLLPALGLRVPFTETSLDWTSQARDLAAAALAEESCVFLERFGRPADLWPRIQALRA